MLNKNPYTWIGLGLLISGIFLSVAAYFIFLTTWLVAMGIAMVILAFILLVLARTVSWLSPEVSSLLLETGTENIAALVEELGIKSKAIYLPSSLTGGRPQALLPLHTNSSPLNIDQALPHRLIVKYGPNPDDTGLLVTTTGTTAVGMLETMPGPAPAEIEIALTHLFTGLLNIADGAKVSGNNDHIQVEIRNPRIENKINWHEQCFGGTLSSTAASIVAEALNKPVTISTEKHDKGKCSIELEVLY